MAWSTREVAELAGTSLRTVRHYHHLGLLDEPERLANGYKQYGVAHLVRLLRIRQLTDLGFSLPRIAAMGDDEQPDQVLRIVDAELAATIDGLRRARVELGLILHGAADLAFDDLPADADDATRQDLAERIVAGVRGPDADGPARPARSDGPPAPRRGPHRTDPT